MMTDKVRAAIRQLEDELQADGFIPVTRFFMEHCNNMRSIHVYAVSESGECRAAHLYNKQIPRSTERFRSEAAMEKAKEQWLWLAYRGGMEVEEVS